MKAVNNESRPTEQRLAVELQSILKVNSGFILQEYI